jgi:Ulp1 family protease
MPLGPRFSANKFQSVLKSALGVGSSGVQSALTHIGAQKSLQNITSTRDAKNILKKLEASGAVSDASHARDVFRKAERVAASADRIHSQVVKEERLSEFDKTRLALKDSVVREQIHSVSISGDRNRDSHRVSVNTKSTAPVSHDAKLSAGAAVLTRPVLLDIPFD